MKSSKNTIMLLVCLILVIVVVGFFGIGYLFGHNYKKIETSITTVYKSIDLDINSSRVINAYSFIPAFSGNAISLNAYQDKLISVSNLDNRYLLAASYDYLLSIITEEEKLPVEGDDTKYKFSVDMMHDVTKTLYGKELFDETFSLGYSATLSLEDGYYVYNKLDGSSEYAYIIRNIDKAYEDQDYVYIEDSFLYYVFNNNENHLYTESDMVNEITLKEDYLNMGITASEIIDRISVDHVNDMRKYKHIFKKNSDNTLYWFSSEPIE